MAAGAFDTPLPRHVADRGYLKRLTQVYPMKRFGDPQGAGSGHGVSQ